MKANKKTNSTQRPNHQKTLFHLDDLLIQRIKAFVVDMFMIYTPILYVVGYLVVGNAKIFTQSQGWIFLCTLMYGIISSLFFCFKGQTPGYRYLNLKLSKNNEKSISFLLALLRFFIWLCSMALVIGLFFPFVHHKRLPLHDVLFHTKVIWEKRN